VTNPVTDKVIHTYSRYSYRKRDIERLLCLTEAFTWEELPTRDPSTGYTTKAGYIPIIQRLAKYSSAILLGFHFVQSAVRVVVNHDMILTAWFPFDASSSPLYELVNVIQVKLECGIYCASTEARAGQACWRQCVTYL
jgi:hypothetical protein